MKLGVSIISMIPAKLLIHYKPIIKASKPNLAGVDPSPRYDQSDFCLAKRFFLNVPFVQ